MRQIVFDIETTGFRFDEGHRVVEIGAVEMLRGAVTGRTFHAYINPERDMPDGAFKVHGLSEAFLSDKPVFAHPDVAAAFVEFAGDAEIIAHNGLAFDMPFINAELKHAGLAPLTNPVFDTLLTAHRKFPGAPASLDALCARFGVDTAQRKKDGHGALLDARLLAVVYVELTGGAQAGLDFSARQSGDAGPERRAGRARARPQPLASLITPEEDAAHRAFIAELGEKRLWSKG